VERFAMTDQWHYQLNGFEIGPVPASEVRRLLLKGRLAPDTPVRSEGSEVWATADRLRPPEEPAASTAPPARNAQHDAPATLAPSSTIGPWPIALLEKGAPPGIPLAVAAMLTWERPIWCLGALLLAGFAGVALRVVARAALDLDAIRRSLDATRDR
jgi:hypothetical protein